MLKKNRRLYFWLLLVLFVGLSGWWSVYFPYDPVRVYRAIPSNALFVSEHDQLGQRLEALLASSLGRSICQMAGISEADILDFKDDPVLSWIFSRLARRKTVFAYVPALDATGQDAWVFSSWGGVRAQGLRWALSLGLLPGFEEVQSNFGYHVWTLQEDETNQTSTRFSIAVLEGIVAGSFSTDPAAARFLENRILRGSAVVPFFDRGVDHATDPADTQGSSSLSPSGTETQLHPDRFWISGHWPELWNRNVREIIAGITVSHDSRAAGNIEVFWRGLSAEFLSNTKPQIRAGDCPDLKILERRLGDAPALLAMAPVALVRTFLQQYGRPEEVAPVLTILEENASENSLMALGLLRQEYNGTMFSLRVPVAVLGLTQCRPGFFDRLRPHLDLLNSRYRLGLIPRKAETPVGPLTLLDSTSNDRLGMTSARQGPALALRDDVLFLSSSGTALEAVLMGSRTASPEWSDPCPEEGLFTTYVWTDFDKAAKPLGDLLAINLLARKIGGHSGVDSSLTSLNLFNTSIESLRPLGQLRLRLTEVYPSLRLQFQLGSSDLRSR